MAHVKVVGVLAEMLIETGQAMQRGGLKLIGRRVVKHDPFITIGARRPFTANGSLVHLTSTLTGGAVTVQKHVAVGAGSVLRSESEVRACLLIILGCNCLMNASNTEYNRSIK